MCRSQWRTRRWTWLPALLSALILVASCSSSSPTPSTPSPQTEADSASKIDDAERAGAIDHDTALLYKLYASLDYGSLPAEYQSSNPAAGEATRTLAELSGRLDQLPAELRAKVNPFFLRPTDPDSVWQTRSAARNGASGSIQLAALSVIQYEYVDTTDPPSVRVWYPGALGQSTLAQELADEIDNSSMWDLEKRAMLGHEPCTDASTPNNGGDGRLDVYLVWPGVGLDWSGRTAALGSTELGKTLSGVAVPQAAGAASCPATSYVIVDGSRDFDHLKSSTAHELFHAFQFSFKNAALGDRDWWAEASATWAMDLVYPNLNHEQVYLDGYWSMAGGIEEGPLDSTAGTPPGIAAYAAYLWPFYLVQKSGDTSGMAVGNLWQASETTSPIKAMSELSGWSDRFKEFALWNWNKDRAVKYIDSGAQIPEAMLSQATVCMDSQGTGNDCPLNKGTTTISVPQGPTTVQYYEGVPQPGIAVVRFDLTGLKGKPGAGIQAILSIGEDQIKVEDWSDKSERKFCITSEDLTKAIVIVTNNSVASGQTLDGEIKVEASAEGCTGLSGTITLVENWQNGDNWSKRQLTVNVRLAPRAGFDGITGWFDDDGSSYTYEGSSFYHVENTSDPSCSFDSSFASSGTGSFGGSGREIGLGIDQSATEASLIIDVTFSTKGTGTGGCLGETFTGTDDDDGWGPYCGANTLSDLEGTVRADGSIDFACTAPMQLGTGSLTVSGSLTRN